MHHINNSTGFEFEMLKEGHKYDMLALIINTDFGAVESQNSNDKNIRYTSFSKFGSYIIKKRGFCSRALYFGWAKERIGLIACMVDIDKDRWLCWRISPWNALHVLSITIPAPFFTTKVLPAARLATTAWDLYILSVRQLITSLDPTVQPRDLHPW